MLDIIINNPYRILGVYANSPKKEIVTNRSKFNAFNKVGKQISFSLDLASILGVPFRTEESISKADSLLTLPVDQVKYAQFWFVNHTPIDQIAFNHLCSGDINSAVNIWSKKESMSSLHNLAVCSLIQSDYISAAHYASRMYNLFSSQFVEGIIGSRGFEKSDLIHSFIDVLSDAGDIDVSSISKNCEDSSWIDYINQVTLEPLILKLEDAIKDAKAQRKENPQNGLTIAKQLRVKVATLLSSIRNIISRDDLKYQMMADKAGLEILQCTIDGYNKSNETHLIARETLSLCKYAQSIVVGDAAKTRCADNVKTIQEIVDDLPPEGVEQDYNQLDKAIADYCKKPDEIKSAKELLNTCKPILTRIGARLGKTSSFYLKTSTRVVDNVLYNIIEEVNAIQKEYPYTADPYVWSHNKGKIKPVLVEAWNTFCLAETLDMEPDFASGKWTKNKATLRQLCNDIGVFENQTQSVRQIIASAKAQTTRQYGSDQTTTYRPNTQRPIYESSSNDSSNGQGISVFVKVIFGIIVIAFLGYAMGECSRNEKNTRPKTPSSYSTTSSNSSSSTHSSITSNSSSSTNNNKPSSNIPKTYSSGASTGATTNHQVVNPKPIEPTYVETHLSTGQYPFGKNKYDQNSLSELRIDNQTDLDAVVVLENRSGKWVRNVFVANHSSYTMTKIPSGRFIMKTMRGNSWNAEKSNGPNHPKGGFMKNCTYSKSSWSDSFDFIPEEDYEGISYPTYSVTLHAVVNGNFHTSATTSDDFFED